MLFDRFRRSTTRAPRLAFYGKLPFDREFLRYHLDSDEGHWITEWVDGAHRLIAARRESGAPRADAELCAILAREDGRSAVAAVLRPSTDGGGRSYPSCAFCVLPSAELRAAWHLSPLWLEPVWRSIVDGVFGAAPANRKDFDAVLDRASIEPEALAAAAARFEEAASAPAGNPWETLTGQRGEPAHRLAATLVQLGRVQREAAGGRGSIAVRVRLEDGAEQSSALQSALWLRLFSVLSGVTSAWPAVIGMRPANGTGARSLCIFGRSPTADDLAYLLSGLGDAAIDELSDVWEAQPEAEDDQRRIDVLLDSAPRCFEDLWRAIG